MPEKTLPASRLIRKIVVAPDSYKGSLSSQDVCQIIAEEAARQFPRAEIVKLPASDGGEGMVDALLGAGRGQRIFAWVKDPLFRDIEASYGILMDGTAAIEMAAASGLTLVSTGELQAEKATTYGTGQLILDALQRGCRKIILGIGGSATTDGGAGLAAALGMRFLTTEGEAILSGGDLEKLDRIDRGAIVPELSASEITIACDVSNPLYGPQGAAHVFGPQKGASPEQVERLDRGLKRLAEVILKDAGINVQEIPGAGAAGGIAVPLIAFSGAKLALGVDVVLEAIGLDRHLQGCDLVITGEGRSDAQSAMGKLISGVGRRAAAQGVPAVVISGALHEGYEALYEQGISAFFSTTREVVTLEEALKQAEKNLRRTARDVFRLIKAVIQGI